MASINTTMKRDEGKFGLTQDQMDSLKKMGWNTGEEKIREILETLQQKYPDGRLTEEQFVRQMDEGVDAYKSIALSLVKRIFAATDRDNSGTVDFYELLMACTLVENEDPKTKMKCLFSLCDSDHDGFLTKTEVVDVLTILMVLGGAFATQVTRANETEVEKDKNSTEEEIKSLVNKTFGEKTQVTEEEFRQLFAETEAEFCDQSAKFFSQAVLAGFMRDYKKAN